MLSLHSIFAFFCLKFSSSCGFVGLIIGSGLKNLWSLSRAPMDSRMVTRASSQISSAGCSASSSFSCMRLCMSMARSMGWSSSMMPTISSCEKSSSNSASSSSGSASSSFSRAPTPAPSSGRFTWMLRHICEAISMWALLKTFRNLLQSSSLSGLKPLPPALSCGSDDASESDPSPSSRSFALPAPPSLDSRRRCASSFFSTTRPLSSRKATCRRTERRCQ
mmetsp:Transcript_67086/g.199500  ORF Transcript_67086/g.199500 Transcript_67086/m.199500 type:complete len:221 (-) Transcript_67086:1183-1845(-)